MFVQHNLLAENANRQLNVSSRRNAKTTEKLSSGYRINRAADDAAGLSISEKMRRQVRGLHQTVDNITEGVGYVQTAEGALNEVHDMLQRMNELSVKAANGTNTEEDRAYIDSEVQALKDEMDRIFRTTTFNDKKIWEAGDRKLLRYYKRQAANFVGTGGNLAGSVTNANCGVLANNNSDYIIKADTADGVWVEWTGWDGEPYATEKVGWDELKANNYRFEMSDYFGDKDPTTNKLYTTDAKGDIVPQFKHSVAFSVNDAATIDDIVKCINNTRMYASSSVGMSSSFQNPDGTQKKDLYGISSSASLYYWAAYASYVHGNGKGHDFDAKDDTFLEPNLTANNGSSNLTKFPAATTVDAAIKSTEDWSFSFKMEGIGVVTGSLSDIEYHSYDRSADDEDIWWYKWWDSNHHEYTSTKYHYPAENLGGVMSALTGTKDEYNKGNGSTDSTPGLLGEKEHGATDSGGIIELSFSLTAQNEFTYGTSKSNSVGSFNIYIHVDPRDSRENTQEAILKNITQALNANTIFDFERDAGNDSHYIGTASAHTHNIDVPFYGGICGFYVQAGTEGGQHISVQYESLSSIVLGLEHTNTLTQESSRNAIDEIKGALQMVSEQRSTFGAYQNRIEHASNINANVEENTQAAESRIRDADIADLMMEYSVNNIIMQAGTSMLTQANQSTQSILELLQ